MIKYTLLLPISDKPYVFDNWCNNIINLNINKQNTQVILGDSTNANEFGMACINFLKTQNFAETKIVSYEQKINKYPGRKYWKQYLKIGTLCSANYDMMSQYIKGDIVLVLEDDISIHPDTYKFLLQTLNNQDVGLAAAIQYEKNDTNTVLAWKLDNKSTFKDENNLNCIEVATVATGCFVTYRQILKNYKLETAVFDEIASTDFCLCRHIRNEYGKKVILDQRVRTQHTYKKNDNIIHVGSMRCTGAIPAYVDDHIRFSIKNKGVRTEGAPIFIISSTGRAGSTWIQRILSSHKKIMIWGEPQGAIKEIYNHYINMTCIKWKGVVQTGNYQFSKDNYNGWIANVSPKYNIKGKAYLRQLMRQHFNHRQQKIWGFKVINWKPSDVNRIYHIFPYASFIFLHRNLIDVERSFNERRGWWDFNFNVWEKQYAELEEYRSTLPYKMHYIDIDYDLFADKPYELCDFLERELNLTENSLNRITASTIKRSIND